MKIRAILGLFLIGIFSPLANAGKGGKVTRTEVDPKKEEVLTLEIGLENAGTNLEKTEKYLEDLQKQLNKKKGALGSEHLSLKFTSPMFFGGGGDEGGER